MNPRFIDLPACGMQAYFFLPNAVRRWLPAALFVLCFETQGAQAQNTPGQVDAAFQGNLALVKNVQAVTILPSGEILAAGNFDGTLALIKTDGSADPAFSVSFGIAYIRYEAYAYAQFNSIPVCSVGVQSNGDFIIAGSFGGPNSNYQRILPDGSIDATFSPATSGTDNSVLAVAVQSDDRIVLGGAFTTVWGSSYNGLARLNADGSLDASFNPGTGLDTGANSAAYCLALQPDGSILVGGSFVSINGVGLNGLARVLSNGAVDGTFNPGGGFNTNAGEAAYAMALQSSGAVIVGGSFAQVNGYPCNNLARLLSTGAVDTSFSSVGCNGVINAVAVQSDGSVLVGGAFTMAGGVSCNNIARFNADGTLDSTFLPGSGPNGAVTSINIQSDAKIVVGGSFTAFNGVGTKPLVRLNTDGSVDTTFQNNTQAGVSILALAQQPDDQKLLVGGIFTSVDNTTASSLVRLQLDGSIDASFQLGQAPGDITLGHPSALIVRPDQEILAAFDTRSDYLIPSLPSITPSPAGTSQISQTQEQAVKEVRSPVRVPTPVAISQTHPNSGYATVALLQTDGQFDSTFTPLTWFVDDTSSPVFVTSLVLQGDGKFLVGGQFPSPLFSGGTATANLARFNADGSPDAEFVPSVPSSTSGSPGAVSAMCVQSADGTIFVADQQSTNTWELVHLSQSGSADADFIVGTAVGGQVNALVLQPNGDVLVGGAFTSFSTSSMPALVRLNPDGSIDASFAPGVFATVDGSVPVVTSLQVLGNNQIVVAGVFETIGGLVRHNLARLNPDGSVDAAFDPGSGADETIRCLLPLADGSLLLGGDFSLVDGVSHAGAVLLFDGAHPAFFTGEVPLSNGVYYLDFPRGNYFGYYSYLTDPAYIYHFDLGYEYVFDANDGKSGVYFYDFASDDFFYTSPTFPFPYLYDFGLNSVLYYYPDPNNPGHYNTNGVRYFYLFSTQQIISK